jgi:hypothetical protein
MIGKRLRKPVTLRIAVSDETAVITINSQGGSASSIASTAIRASAVIATR